VTHGGVKEGLLVWEVPVEGSDADTGAPGDGVSCGLAANLQSQFDRGFDNPLPVPLRISSHPTPTVASRTIALTRPQTECIPPVMLLSR
jgi:hypothetical protein